MARRRTVPAFSGSKRGANAAGGGSNGNNGRNGGAGAGSNKKQRATVSSVGDEDNNREMQELLANEKTLEDYSEEEEEDTPPESEVIVERETRNIGDSAPTATIANSGRNNEQSRELLNSSTENYDDTAEMNTLPKEVTVRDGEASSFLTHRSESDGTYAGRSMNFGDKEAMKAMIKTKLFPKIKMLSSNKQLEHDQPLANLVYELMGHSKKDMEWKAEWWNTEKKDLVRKLLGTKRNNVTLAMKQKFFGK